MENEGELQGKDKEFDSDTRREQDNETRQNVIMKILVGTLKNPYILTFNP